MKLVLTIPDRLAAPLQKAHGDDLARAALESLALDGYRSGRLSSFHVQQLLDFQGRLETEDWLGSRGANWQYGIDDLKADGETLSRILPGIGSCP